MFRKKLPILWRCLLLSVFSPSCTRKSAQPGLKKGHRIRIAVMNACDNYSFPNSNTGENEAYVNRTVVGTMAIHHSPAHPSHVLLPILKR